MQKGLTIIYWGDGKGKTTAAIGAAMRALGQGQRVLFAQFMKGEEWKTGEAKMFEKARDIEFHIFGKGWVGIKGDQKPITEHQSAARAGLEFVKRVFQGKATAPQSSASAAGATRSRAFPATAFDVVILDEILSAVDAGLLTVDEIKELIRAKPPPVHLLMTGHQQYPELAELVDVITNMEKIKHPFDQGIQAQKGLDY